MLNIKSSHTQSKYLSHCPSAVVLFCLSAPPVPLLFISLRAVSPALWICFCFVCHHFPFCFVKIWSDYCTHQGFVYSLKSSQADESSRRPVKGSRSVWHIAFVLLRGCDCVCARVFIHLHSLFFVFSSVQSISFFLRGSWPVHITYLCFRHDELTESVFIFTLTFDAEVCICVRVCL